MPRPFRPPTVGTRFGRLIVCGVVRGQKRMLILCRCDCGVECSKPLQPLTTGKTKSCGCYRVDFGREKSKTPGWMDAAHAAQLHHGESRHRRVTVEYRTWQSLIARCMRPGGKYVERGIRVCERWMTSFENFLADMGRRPPGIGWSIDRIDNNGNYEPSNCRWATAGEQARNRSITRWLIINGKRTCYADAGKLLGIHKTCVAKRIEQYGVLGLFAGHRAKVRAPPAYAQQGADDQPPP